MYCRNCGSELDPGAKFCGKCGTKVEEQEQPQEQPPKKPKKSPVLWIVLGVCAVMIIGIVIAVVSLVHNFGEDDRETAVMQPDHYESSAREESSEVSALPEESSKEDSKETSKDTSKETKEESLQPEKTVKLECGAEIELDATIVDLTGFAVSQLKGIEKCTQMQSLRIDGGSLTDLTPLVGLTSLQVVILNNVPVQNLSPLKSVPGLMYLDILDTQVTAAEVQEFMADKPDVNLVGYVESTYEVIAADCTWDEAKAQCEARGGHLVTISDEAEMKRVAEQLKSADLAYLWLGGYSENGQWKWVTDEPWGGYVRWYKDEPSGQDVDGIVENRLCLWNVNNEGWTMNDQRNDLPSVGFTRGRMGYICETETVAGFKR